MIKSKNIKTKTPEVKLCKKSCKKGFSIGNRAGPKKGFGLKNKKK